MKRQPRVEDLLAAEVPSQPVISPDGAAVVYVLRTADQSADENTAALWTVSAIGGPARPLTRGPVDTCPAWSPSGDRVAFLRAKDGPQQVWIVPFKRGEPEPLTALTAGAGQPVWSPDGRHIAFAAPVDTWAESVKDGDRDHLRHAPIVIDRLGYRADGIGLLRGLRQHVHVADVATGAVRQVTTGDWHAADPAWSPDGAHLAFTAAMAPDADLTGESAVYVADVQVPHPTWRLVGDQHGLAGPVTWTPDGGALVVVGRRDVSVGHAELLRVPLDGGAVQRLGADFDYNIMPGAAGYPGARPQFAADGTTLLFCARVRGCTHVYALGAADDTPRLLVGGTDRVAADVSVAVSAPRAAMVVAAPDTYGEVRVLDLETGDESLLTGHTPTDIAWPEVEERVFTVSDGSEVHGWLMRDPAAPTPAPLLVDVHGGPHNAWSPVRSAAHPYHDMLVSRGWAILLLNPRGSDGYGERYFTAAVGAWGLADQRDFLEPVDQLVKEDIADRDRLALCGYSYGGYMACWLTGQTDRFAAAVAGGAVSDLASMAGTCDIGPLFVKLELGGLPYDDSDRLAEQSPLTYASQVRTPTLILHGLADQRCPVSQAEQWFAALRDRGVPTQLVLYPGSSHELILDAPPSQRADYAQRTIDWFARHAERGSAPMAASLDRDHWQRRLAELAERYGVPGAVLGVARGDDTLEVAHGVANVETGVEVTTDTLFEIASVAKVWTASAIMTLVDSGKLDLDEPVVTYLPDLQLADPVVTRRVTTRHLLTHTSGIDGDFFRDTGRGDECIQRYVEALADLPLNHPLGSTWSYCNAGYVLAGRLIEVLTGQVWDTAMREILFVPLALRHTVTMPEHLLMYRAAAGHVHAAGEPPRRRPDMVLPRSNGPAGSTLAATAGDVLAFARMHLTGGLAADGTRVLSEDAVRAMQAEQARLPDPYTLADSWGLGWFRLDWSGTRLIGHDGNSIGQSAFLRLLPQHDVAVTLLTNGGAALDLYQTLVRDVFREVAGVEMAEPLSPPERPVRVDAAPHVGTYERTSVRMEVLNGPDGARLRIINDDSELGIDEPQVTEFDLVPVRDGLYVVRLPGAETWKPVTFYSLPDGTPYLHFGARATRRTA